MTGFASQNFELMLPDAPITVTMHLKSLNGKFFEATCRLPSWLAPVEPLLVKKLKERLVRGTVYCALHISSPLALASKPMLVSPVVEGYLSIVKELEKSFEGQLKKESLSPAELLNLPNVIDFAEQQPNENLVNHVLAWTDKLIELLIKERNQEGAALEKDLASRFATIEQSVLAIRQRAEILLAERKTKLLQNLNELLSHSAPENRDLHIQSVFGQLEKLDINEEIVRITAHLTHAHKTVSDQSVEKGKKLDFILQEMFREINTIGAKCSDSDLGSLAILVKVELEKSREQIQNIV